MPTTARSRSGLAVAGLAATCASLLAACGGSSTTTSAASSTTAAGSTASLTACLEQHGIPASAASQLATLRGGRPPGTGTPPSGMPSGTPPSDPGSGSVPAGGAGPRGSLPAGVTQSQLRTALQACGAGGRFGGGGLNSAAFAAYRNCLQLHGVTLPTGNGASSTSSTASTSSTTSAGSSSTTTAGGPGGRGFGGLDPNDPTVKAAEQACASLRPARSTTTSTTAAA